MPAKVLWLIAGLARGGAEQLLVATARRLDRDRYSPEVAYVLDGYDALAPRLHELDVPVHDLGARSLADLRWAGRLRRLVQSQRYEIVHTHSPAPAVIARLALANGAAFVHTEHSSWPSHNPLTRIGNAMTYGRNTRVLAVSNAVASSISSRHRRRVEVSYHGVEVDAVRSGAEARLEARAALGLENGVQVIGTVGNFSGAKGHDLLIEVFSRLAADHQQLQLVLVGFGSREVALRQQADRAGLAKRVVFAGSRDDVQRLLPAFDVFVLPSRHEGLGLSMLEAMAAGVPCVAFNVEGVPETLREEVAGLLVPAEDVPAMAAAISELLADAPRREKMGAEGQRVAADFSLDAAVTRLAATYDEVRAVGRTTR